MYLISLLFASALALFENSYTIKQVNRVGHFSLILEADTVGLAYFYADDCENCQKAAQLIEKVADDQDGIIKVYAVNCQEIQKDPDFEDRVPYCTLQNREQLPQISFFEPPVYSINPYTGKRMLATEHRFQGEASPDSLGTFGHKYLPNNIYTLSSLEEFKTFEQSDPKLNKVILFTAKKTTPAIFKALGVQFYQRVKLGIVFENHQSQKLIDEFDVKEFPQLITMENNGDQTYSREVYENDLLFKPMKKFLNRVAVKERVPLEQELKKEEPKERREREPKAEKTADIEIIPLTESVLNKQLLRNDKPALVHVYKDQPHPLWVDVQKKYKTLFDYYILKVEDNDTLATEQLNIRSFPSIKFFQVGNAGKKKAIKIAFPQGTTIDEINKDIQELIDDKTISLSEHTLQMHISQSIQENKVAIFLFYNTPQISLTYRIVSQLEEYSKYKFFSFKDAPEGIIKQFQVTGQPQIVAVFREVEKPEELEEEVKPNQVRSGLYTGKMDLHAVKEFLDVFDKEKKKSSKKITELTEQNLSDCAKKQQTCFIALLNGEHKEVQHDELLTRWDHQLEVLDRVKNQHGPKGQFFYVDAYCYSELLLSLDISDDTLPNYVAYNGAKKSYSKLIGRFDYESLNRFVDNYSKGKASQIPISKLQITEKDCDQVRAQRNISQSSDDLDDEILREQLEEERLRREQIKQELKQEKKKGKKNKKSKDEL